MSTNNKRSFPRQLFALLAVSGLVACGIFIGIMSIEGASGLRLAQAGGFGLMGLAMFWGALKS